MNRSIAFLFYMSVINLALSSSVNRADYGEIKLFQASVSYSVESTVLLNDASRRDKEVSYKVKAALDVHPVWTESDVEFMLKFDLISPQLYSRGKHVSAEYMPVKSIWDSYPHTTFYAHWKHGLIQTAYLDPNELLDIQNFKRSLISLFQFQVVDGEGNETDVSGTCKVTYESPSMQVIRKFKTACQSVEWSLEDEEGSEEVEARRVTRYTLSAALDALQEVYAEELLALGDASEGAGLKARAWLRLARAAAPPAAAPPAPALGAVPPALAAAPLVAPPPADLAALLDPPSGAEELQAAVAEAARAAGAEGGGGGRRADARAALRLAAALRRPAPAAAAALDALLHDAADPQLLDVVCAALGQAPGAAAHAAAARFLRLRGGDVAARPARAYLQALALAPRAPPPALRAAAAAAAPPAAAALRDAALLAAAAAARAAPPDDARALRDQLVAELARCKDDECRRVHLLALGNMRRADVADVLLQHAERGAPAAALAALGALAALPAAALAAPARLRRLERLALEPRALEPRAAALDLLLRLSAPAPFALPRALLALRREPAPAPLRRLAARRLAALAPRRAPLAALLRLLPPELRGWDELAQPGTTSVLEREAGAAGGWRARLDSVQLESGGALRRGRVRLRALSPRGAAHDVLAVELWTTGMQAFTGGAPGDDEPVSGGLALSVGGVRLPDLTLFSGQAELLAHVWAGTGSEPTPVLRAVRPLGGARAAAVLLGGAPLLYRRDAALALALDAQAQVSLWSRSARTQLRLRAAAAARGEARAAPAWGALAAAAALEAEPSLHIAADLDFYDGVSLCVRVSTTDFRHSYNVTLTSELGAAPRRVRRRRSQSWASSGRTLALGAPNDATCRVLGAGD